MRAVILIPQRQEGEKTTGGGISELSLSQRSWKAKGWGDGRTERGGGWGGSWHSVQSPLAESGSFI